MPGHFKATVSLQLPLNFEAESVYNSYMRTRQLKYFTTEKGKAALKRAQNKLKAGGYYKYGRGSYNLLRVGARKRDIPFEWTYDEFHIWWTSTPDNCFYCGKSYEESQLVRNNIINYTGNNSTIIKLKRFLDSGVLSKISRLTIDRKNNDCGYSPENVVKCYLLCNMIKGYILDFADMQLISKNVINRIENAINK